MKAIKVYSPDFGIVEVKPRKVFSCEGIDFAIAPMPYKVFSSDRDAMYLDKCIHLKSGWTMPIFTQRKDTLKDFVRVSCETISKLKKDLGEEVFLRELDNKETLN
jgi:hypothetical protein